VHDMATVTGSGPTPSGTVTFTWYPNTTCDEATGVGAGIVALDASGIAHPRNDETVTIGGNAFKATYSGDGTYNPSTGDCEPLNATQLSSKTVTVIHAGKGADDTTSAAAITSAAIGSTVHDMATVTGSGPTPTGTVTFTWYP